MKAVQKAALAFYRYLGKSDNVARASAKKLAPQLSEALSGCAKGERKNFCQAIENLTKENCDVEKEYKTLSNILCSLEDKHMRGEMKRVSKAVQDGSFFNPEFKTSALAGMKTSERISRDMALYDSLTLPIATRRGTLSVAKEVPGIVSQSIDDMVRLSPEQISRIADDAIKAYNKEAMTLMGRTLSYPFTKLGSYLVPSSMRGIISKLTKLPKSQFNTEYYKYLTESRNLAGRAPAEIKISTRSAGLNALNILSNGPRCEGGFNMMTNSIEFTKEFSQLSRGIQAELLSHELKHFEQADTIIRTYGIDRYIQAQKNGMLKRAYKDLGNTKTQREIEELVEKRFKEQKIEEQIRTSFAKSAQAPRISPSTDARKQAAKYIKGVENYTGVSKNGIFTQVTKEYFNNPLEKEAYLTGFKSSLIVRLLESLNLKSV